MSLALALLLAAAPPPPEIVVIAPALAPFAAPGVPAPELAAMRGGLMLPNGLDVAIGIDLQTRVDGVLVLHTIYASEGQFPGIRVFTDGTDPVKTAPATVSVTSPGVPGTVTAVVARSPSGTTIFPGEARAATTVNLVNGDPSTWVSADGQTQVPVSPDRPVTIAPGVVTLTRDDQGAVVQLQAADITVRQLIGRATGVAVANTANDRSIDTVSSVNVDVRGLSPGVLASALAAQRAVFDALTR